VFTRRRSMRFSPNPNPSCNAGLIPVNVHAMQNWIAPSSSHRMHLFKLEVNICSSLAIIIQQINDSNDVSTGDWQLLNVVACLEYPRF
jgi:hypothetical protein